MSLAFIIEGIAIITFIAGVIKYLIVSPLQQAINALEKTIAKLESTLESLTKEQNDMGRRLVVVEESAKAAHKRLDGIEK